MVFSSYRVLIPIYFFFEKIQNLRIKQVFHWRLRRKAEPAPLLTDPVKKLAGFFSARVRESDQRHQDERDDIATTALKPEIRLLEDRAA